MAKASIEYRLRARGFPRMACQLRRVRFALWVLRWKLRLWARPRSTEDES